MKETRAKLTRRNFLLAATAGTAVTAAAVIGKQQQTEQPIAADAAKPTGKGYQVTEHVENYYRTARI